MLLVLQEGLSQVLLSFWKNWYFWPCFRKQHGSNKGVLLQLKTRLALELSIKCPFSRWVLHSLALWLGSGGAVCHSCSLPLESKCVFWPLTCVVGSQQTSLCKPHFASNSFPFIACNSFITLHEEVRAGNDKCDSRDFGGNWWSDWKSPYTGNIAPLWELGCL